MTPKWLIEIDVFPEDTDPLLESLERQGIGYTATKLYDIEEGLSRYPGEDCVIFYGSLRTARQLRRKAKWIPGVYYNIPRYECVDYYAHLGKYLLNGNYIILPFGDLLRQKEFLYESVGADRAIFVRPSRADKPFTGRLIYKEYFDKDVDGLGFKQMEPHELIVVSEPRNIKFEWRFIVVEGRVITGSQYKENDKVAIKEGYPQGAFDFAANIASIFSPDLAWVCDVCQTKFDEFKIMEVGCFSCAGLYKCDREAVVKAVNESAVKEWESFQVY